MKESFLCAYRCLNTVYREHGFSSIVLNDALQNIDSGHRALTSKIVYGVLDRDLELDFIIRSFAKTVKPSVMPLLKIGVYCLKYLSLANHAVVNECVELAKTLGKGGISGFINATLKRVSEALANHSIVFPKDKWQNLSVRQSFPLWALKQLATDFDEETAKAFIQYRPQAYDAHVRINTKLTKEQDFAKLLAQNEIKFEKSFLPDAFCVSGNLSNINTSLFTNQSAASMIVCKTAAEKDAKRVLDVCAAPGGKSVYLAELLPQAQITSCDLHPHRVDLIRKYAKRMKTDNVCAVQNDATMFRQDFEKVFDVVLCDVPCSGFGVLSSKPDIKLFREQGDILSLAELQSKILAMSAKYVKSGGTLVYSTCTVFKQENDDVVKKFLEENPQFEAETLSGYDAATTEGFLQFLPHRDGIDGFFVAKMRLKI